jgi:hypothetical protein
MGAKIFSFFSFCFWNSLVVLMLFVPVAKFGHIAISFFSFCFFPEDASLIGAGNRNKKEPET